MKALFQPRVHGSTFRREILAGLTTFSAMAYILAVNPAILSTTGMDAGALITATALAAALSTALMGFMTNYPIALAPGMGLNAFFAFTICGLMKIPWQAALGLIFWQGVLFLILSLTGIRARLVAAVPPQLKLATTCGIGLFILFIGLKNGGLIVANPATFVTLGKISSPGPLLVFAGILLAAILTHRKVPGAILISVAACTVAGLFLPAAEGTGKITAWPSAIVSLPASLAPTFFALDFGWPLRHLAQALPLILALLFVEIFDAMGTLLGVAQRAGLLDEKGNLPRIKQALQADSCGTIIGSLLGTSTTTSYIESAAGVEEGGRTGLTALVVAGCFLLALFFAPLILAIPPLATAPALVIVGIFMMQSAKYLEWDDLAMAAPAVLTMIVMPLAFSISEGIAIGFITFVVLMLGTGRGREVTAFAYGLAVIFLAHFLLT